MFTSEPWQKCTENTHLYLQKTIRCNAIRVTFRFILFQGTVSTLETPCRKSPCGYNTIEGGKISLGPWECKVDILH